MTKAEATSIDMTCQNDNTEFASSQVHVQWDSRKAELVDAEEVCHLPFKERSSIRVLPIVDM